MSESELTVEEKKEYCCQNIKNLEHDDLKQIYRYICQLNIDKEVIPITEGRQGLFINLDKIADDDIINKIYQKILNYNQQLYMPLDG